ASRTLVCVAAAGPADAAKWVGCHLPAGAGIAWLAVNARRLVASEGALTDGPPAERDVPRFAEETGQSVIAVPLMGQDRGLRGPPVYRLDPGTWELARGATSSSGGDVLTADPVLPRGSGLEGVAATTRQPVPTADLLDDPRVVLSAEARREITASGQGAALA